jgi:hypothetical protein
MKRESRPRNLGAFLPVNVLNRVGVRLDEASRLTALWRRYAPAPLVEHVRPIRYATGVLTLDARSAAWASRLRHRQQELLAQLRAEPCFRALRALRIRVRPTAGSPPPAAAPQPTRLSIQAAQHVSAAAQGIDDPQLRAALARLGADAASPAAPRKHTR